MTLLQIKFYLFFICYFIHDGFAQKFALTVHYQLGSIGRCVVLGLLDVVFMVIRTLCVPPVRFISFGCLGSLGWSVGRGSWQVGLHLTNVACWFI